ncbi:MAG TPA: PAS domain S-box protein, partial [Gaiellaceae bacterium]
PDLLVMDVNEQTCRMTGRSRDELIGTRFDGCFTDPSAAAEGVYRTLRDGTVADYELELAARAGEPIVVSFNAARFTDAAGAVQGVFAAARDVTDRRRAAAAIAKSRERERVQAEQAAIFAEFAEGVATLDPEPGGVLESVTVQVADFIGDTCGVFVVGDDGQTLRNIAWHSRAPEAVEFARGLLAVRPYTTETGPAGEVFRTGRTVVFREADMTSLREQLPAEYRPLVDRFGVASAVYLPLRAGGETLGVIVTYRFAGHPAYADAEIAFLEEFGARASLAYENARQGAARKRSQELLDAVFQTLPDLICIAGTDGYFRVLNPAWESAIGWTIAELCAKPYVEFVHPDDRQRTLDEHDKQVLRGQRVISFENRYRCRDGSYRWLQWNSLPLAERGILVANARDITEHKQAEEALAHSHRELERRSEELERSNRDLEQFAYVASHDLQEPLRMVSSYTTLLAEDLGDSLGETARRHLGYAHDGAMRMQQLVSDLLRYSRVSRAADESRQRVDCDQLVETVEVDL